MKCIKPSYMGFKKNNYRRWLKKDDFYNKAAIAIPCGKCLNCMKLRQLHLCHLMELEAKNKRWKYAYFITLTYSNENIKMANNNYVDLLQKWLKRLRKKTKLKYLITTELGGKTFRLHHHAFLFCENAIFNKIGSATKIHNNYYFNALDSCWDYGFNSTTKININDTLTINKAVKYVSKYIAKNPLKLLKSNGIGIDYINTHIDKNGRYIYNGKSFYKSKFKKLKSSEIIENNYNAYTSGNVSVLENRTIYEEPKKY